ncbi:MAG: hypothetical protein N3E37_00710 [Candidatus Micrarchaeota archaeon]|nr:hypothetical protein [Candidatus Micrarchaeota archaeon]
MLEQQQKTNIEKNTLNTIRARVTIPNTNVIPSKDILKKPYFSTKDLARMIQRLLRDPNFRNLNDLITYLKRNFTSVNSVNIVNTGTNNYNKVEITTKEGQKFIAGITKDKLIFVDNAQK